MASILKQQHKQYEGRFLGYGGANTVLVNEAVEILKMRVPSVAHVGLLVGLGVSDTAAWTADSFFILYVGGKETLIIRDQLGDLLRPQFLPVEVKAGEEISLTYFNSATAPPVDVAATIEGVL